MHEGYARRSDGPPLEPFFFQLKDPSESPYPSKQLFQLNFIGGCLCDLNWTSIFCTEVHRHMVIGC